MEAKYDEAIRLKLHKIEELREELEEEEEEEEEEEDRDDADEAQPPLQLHSKQGFSAFGAKPFTCDVGKACVAGGGMKSHDTRAPDTAETFDRSAHSASDGESHTNRGGDGAAAAADDDDDDDDVDAGDRSSDCDWQKEAGTSAPKADGKHCCRCVALRLYILFQVRNGLWF
jgi:hypothetical protein